VIARFFELVAFVVVAADAFAFASGGGHTIGIDTISIYSRNAFLLGSGHAACAAFVDVVFVEAGG
jgi:hypothetical protein